jgi:AcrR family transcriptional regulator
MAETTEPVPRVVRTQAMRRAQTRTRLLDATIECLIELGYANTTTPLVCERAGLSRGALLHHFPSKIELVIAAVAHLAARTGENMRQQAAEEPSVKGGTTERSLELYWQNFSGPLFYAALELWVAARTDRELHKHVYDFERILGKSIRGLSESLGTPTAESRAAFNDQMELTLHLLRGMALQRILRRDDRERRRLFELWKRTVLTALGAAGG